MSFLDMDLSEEKQLIKEAKKDPEVFGLLFEKNYRPIFNYILRRTANVELSQDLTSETFLKALKNLGRFEWQNVPFSAWLYRIATNEINGFFRKHKKYISVALDKVPEIPANEDLLQEIKEAEDEMQSKKQFMEIQKHVAGLSEECQTIISLKYFEKKKISEISQILEKPEGTIKSKVFRSLQELKKKMES